MSRATPIALVLLVVAALLKLPTLDQPLTDNFAWRQTQTAWTALIYHREGIDLLNPQVPVHGPPWTFGFEFPLFQALGALLMDAGLPADPAMRLLGLVTFLLTGWLLYRLTDGLAGPIAALAALAAFLFSPFGLLWGRSSLIEYMATTASLGFLMAGIRWMETGKAVHFGLALAAGLTAMLVKITTGFFYLLPLLAYRKRDGAFGLRDTGVLALVIVPAVVGRLWIAYTDALKAASPATAFQTSSQMMDFNFGTPAMRADPEFLAPIGVALLVGLGGSGLFIWVPAAVARIRRLPQPWFLVALIGSVGILPPLVLTPLYGTQNYYPAALSPVVALVVGLGWAGAWTNRGRLVARLSLAAGVGLWVVTLLLTRDYWLMSYASVVDRDRSLEAADFVRERTEPGDWVVIAGRGWDPTVLYYADRRGYMIDERRDGPGRIEELRSTGRYALFVECPYQDACRLMEER